ncbi:WD40 repeat-like protein [Metschnikowia bicuspidata var. bicuspidata NRRL YB-4993]|uniref:WD40 repeat-like protein n=1 Tax=Metschnikowia bicuspidata var. bicuspidata NRRL YB-4993 TaxID=869754 RepID=A0A1A0H751_9ASCO|nr:WD40 repeat-like protein [Metschnikowia bicuspidata var. bicuspidata NRRL YB-4993]OBA19856.1 WD40 repeat-like protein [Metschnikowia bicuspidata var. bicuspidata NRRL YB-4993]
MGKQYISTVSAAQAHKLDILAVAMTNKYTITVSSDGYAAFWDNKQDEVHMPHDFAVHKLINKIGIHHVAVFEDVPSGLTTRVLLVAFACFDGLIQFYQYTNDDLESFVAVATKLVFSHDFWCPGFYKDPESTQHFFVGTKANGTTAVHELNIFVDENEDVTVDLATEAGVLNSSKNFTSYPNALSVSPTADALCAVGYTSGDVVVYSIKNQKQVFTFHSTDLQVKQGKGSTAVPRVLAFSPGGSILAVARDNQSAGSITLYDVKYGENVGSLTTLTHSAKTTIGGFAHEGWIMGLSFNEDGSLLASCGFDKCLRVWNLELREREATILVNVSDLEDTTHDEVDSSICSGIAFIKKGVRGGPGGDANEGLCVVSFDRGVRWYREAGGI